MKQETAGRNMIDVKKSNRGAILNLLYQNGGMSRKEIAQRLGLTPAAITLITSDMLEEGLLREIRAEHNSMRVGRKEIIIGLRSEQYVAIGVYINRTKIKICCMDFKRNLLFEDQCYTADCRRKSADIMEKACRMIETDLEQYDVARTRKLVGVGIGVRGIVDPQQGISLNSYHVWERNVRVRDFFERRLGLPVTVSNNVCALASGEVFFSQGDAPDNALFIKYGPGVGAAHLTDLGVYQGFICKPMELGHLIVNPMGQLCSCGSKGCLETVAGYDAIIENVRAVFSAANTPALYRMADALTEHITMELIVQAYGAGDRIIEEIFGRAAFFLAMAMRNSISLFDPSDIILYGELFENKKFWDLLQQKLSEFPGCDRVMRSRFNLKLDTTAPAATMVSEFFCNGGILPQQNRAGGAQPLPAI